MNPGQTLFLVGPTASGKTEVALSLGRRVGLEVISCDSMQVYKGMPILTQSPPKRILKAVPHHLVSFLDPSKEFNAGMFRMKALKLIEEIRLRKKLPLVAGGTGLYMKSLLDGLFEGPGKDKKFRKRLEKISREKGSAFLHGELSAKDPEAAAKIHPNDLRRIVRALEVIHLAGAKFSLLKKKRSGIWDEENVRIYGIRFDRKVLYDRINRRVERMFRAGVVNEVKKYSAGTRKLSRNASLCLGFREIKEYIGGKSTLAETKERLKQNTRRYAKRQISWFNQDKRIRWIDADADTLPAEIAEEIWKKQY